MVALGTLLFLGLLLTAPPGLGQGPARRRRPPPAQSPLEKVAAQEELGLPQVRGRGRAGLWAPVCPPHRGWGYCPALGAPGAAACPPACPPCSSDPTAFPWPAVSSPPDLPLQPVPQPEPPGVTPCHSGGHRSPAQPPSAAHRAAPQGRRRGRSLTRDPQTGWLLSSRPPGSCSHLYPQPGGRCSCSRSWVWHLCPAAVLGAAPSQGWG